MVLKNQICNEGILNELVPVSHFHNLHIWKQWVESTCEPNKFSASEIELVTHLSDELLQGVFLLEACVLSREFATGLNACKHVVLLFLDVGWWKLN